MESFEQFAEGKDSSNRIKAVVDIVDQLRIVLGKYDIATRNYVWEHLESPKGRELMSKILRNPKTYLSDSEFKKLVEKR